MEKYKFRLCISVFSREGVIIKEFTIEANTKDEVERKAKEWIDANPTSDGIYNIEEIS
ncbi:unnamed protein product [marine sediment metagenome]|uniref:Uncharacterized protein n=1 Tax=marine sediment metagenome TaxID=412755 RepID=X1F4S1_9ZZZZ